MGPPDFFEDGDGSEPSALGDSIPLPPAADGKGSSDSESLVDVPGDDSCSPHGSVAVPSEKLPFALPPPILLGIGEPRDNALGSSA